MTDADGQAIYGAVVRGTGYPRGPATLTDRQGRFLLPGIDPRDGVQVFHPTIGQGEKTHIVSRVAADVPLDLVWTIGGLAVPDPSGTLAIRAHDGGGAPGAGLHLLVVGADGRCTAVVTDDGGEASLEVPCGDVLIRGDDPFEPFEVAEAKAVVREGQETTVALALSARARLRIEGDIPADLGVGLASAGREYGESLVPTKKGPAAPVWLPADLPAVVRVSAEQGTWSHFVTVGQAVDGVRTAVVRMPPAHRIRLAADGALDGAFVRLAPESSPRSERLYDVVAGVVSIRRGGRFLLTVEGEEGQPERVVRLDLPPLPSGAVERTIDLAKDARAADGAGAAHLLVTMSDGSPVPEMRVAGERFSTEGAESPVEVWAPGVVLLSPKGLQPLHVVVPRPGEQKVQFALGGIDLSTVDGAGAPVAASVLIDGVEHVVKEGRLSLRGLGAGPHAIVVQRNSSSPRVQVSRLWRFTLGDGEVRSKALPLP